MKGRVLCEYVGGPWDGRVEEVPAIYCRQSIGVESKTYFAAAPWGGLHMQEGPRSGNWVGYKLFMYEKQPRPARKTGATYKFSRMILVKRCKQRLPDKGGRRCRNAAQQGKLLCKRHGKIRAQKPQRRRRR